MLYCAHAIFYFNEQEQETFFVHENVYLIESENPDQATESALQICREIEDAHKDGNIEIDGRKAVYLFAGLRKLIEIESSPGPVSQSGLAGLELTYSVFEVDNLEQVHALARGEMVEIFYRE